MSNTEGENCAKSLGIPFIETSSKLRVNIEETMFTLLRLIPRSGTEYKIVILGGGGVVSFHRNFKYYI